MLDQNSENCFLYLFLLCAANINSLKRYKTNFILLQYETHSLRSEYCRASSMEKLYVLLSLKFGISFRKSMTISKEVSYNERKDRRDAIFIQLSCMTHHETKTNVKLKIKVTYNKKSFISDNSFIHFLSCHV